MQTEEMKPKEEVWKVDKGTAEEQEVGVMVLVMALAEKVGAAVRAVWAVLVRRVLAVGM
jgi:hypothetical protein